MLRTSCQCNGYGFFRGKGAYKIQRLGMIDGLQMLLQAFAAYGQAFFKHHRRFTPGQRITLNGVAGIGQFYP